MYFIHNKERVAVKDSIDILVQMKALLLVVLSFPYYFNSVGMFCLFATVVIQLIIISELIKMLRVHWLMEF